MLKRPRALTAILFAATSATLMAGSTSASAASVANTVSVGSSASGGSVSGTCAFVASLPQTGSINNIPVVFSGTATATGVAVSTSIRCSLTNGGSGSAGNTVPGPEAVTAGQGSYYRLAPSPQICATVSAAFSNGSTAPSKTSCHAL